MSRPTVVLDYGLNNVRSVVAALRRLGEDPVVRDAPHGAGRLVLPGVGAFGAAMAALAPHADAIRDHAREGRPLLGICLGQQLLFDASVEHGRHRGLGLIPGDVRYLRGDGVKVPHVGWNALRLAAPSALGPVADGDQAYFVHSLHCAPADPADALAWADHGERFVAAVRRGNVWGAQFHPEKSGPVGLAVLGHFLAST